MNKFELLKKLEHFIAFQSVCLAEGNWEEFDLTENKVKELEQKILTEKQEK